MSINIVALSATKAQPTFDGWSNCPKNYQTRSGWESAFRTVRAGEQPTAFVVETMTRRLDCADHTYEIEKQYNLFHVSQTRTVKKTPLNLARHAFWQCFVQPSDRERLIRWTKGEWKFYEDGEKYWDAEADVWGWKTYQEWFGKKKCIDHSTGKDLYGVFGAKKSFYLLIDLDLHKKSLKLFLRRLSVLLDAFHGVSRCHWQVSDEDAGGVHLILFFGKLSSLKSRLRWIENQLSELDAQNPDVKFFKTGKGKRKLNIEVYPSTGIGHRLPLARGRTMLLDGPLEPVHRSGRDVQDIVGYVKWLDDPSRKYMSKDDVFRHIVERLDLSCSSSCSQKNDQRAEKVAASENSPLSNAVSSEKTSYPLRKRTRGAIIGFWQRGEPGHFRHLNAAVLVTLRALHAEGLVQNEAVELLMNYVEELPNQNLSSRLPDDLPEIRRLVVRNAEKIWKSGIQEKWKAAVGRWSSIGFHVGDKTTWAVSGTVPEVVVDCEEIEFSEEERRQIAVQIAPLLVGRKQARKPEKLAEVVRAVAYFLRYVRCCDREIPVSALPAILSGFDLKVRNHDKQRMFLRKLAEMDWIYFRTDYYHPAKHGGKGKNGRARAYGIGKAMAGKFADSSFSYSTTQNRIYILSPTFCEATENDLEIPCFEDQIATET